jgi:WD40 repeat protein
MDALGSNFFVTGGTLRPDAPSYVERQADKDLFDGLLAGEFCYVLTSRQMGKSSLMVRTANRLRDRGVHVIVLDLTAIGQNLSPDQWYDGLLIGAGRQLRLEDEFDEFWRQHSRQGPCQRFFAALCEAGLAQRSGRLVVFVDEIDAVRSLGFSTDEFFAAIRECYNRRSIDSEFERLTFCLLGVATPGDLIRDARTTPFNIGRRVELNDFTTAEAAGLARGLERQAEQPPAAAARYAGLLLQRILHWTNGHPYLTQRLCRAVADTVEGGAELAAVSTQPGAPAAAMLVDRLCEELFLTRRAREQDDNLVFARERMLRSEVDVAALLTLYARVLRHMPLEMAFWERRLAACLIQLGARGRVADDPASPLIAVLRLAGLVRVDNDCLEIRNLIYARVFGERWVRQHMPDAEMRRQRAAFWLGVVRTAGLSAVVLAAITVLAVIALDQSRRAKQKSEESQRLLVRLRVEYGVRQMEEKDLLSTFQWFAEGLKLDSGDANRAEMHRVRLATSLAQCPRLLQLWAVTSAVTAVDFSPHGRWVMATSEDGAAHVWDSASGQLAAPVIRHEDFIKDARFSPDGNHLATAGNRTVRLWQLPSGKAVAPVLISSGEVNRIAFSPDGKRLVAAGKDRTATVWDCSSGQAVLTLPHDGPVECACFSPDGRQIATAGETSRAVNRAGKGGFGLVWDAATGQQVAGPLLHSNKVISIRFSPDGRHVVTAAEDNSGRVWSAATGLPITPPLRHTTWLTEAVFSPDNRSVLTASYDNVARVWDAETGRPLSSPMRHGHSVLGGTFSPDGRRVLTACFDQTAQLWDAEDAERVLPPLKHSGNVAFVRFSPDGHRLLTVGWDLLVRLWDIASSGAPAVPLESRQRVTTLTVSPDGSRILTVEVQGASELWHASTGERIPWRQNVGLVFFASFDSIGRCLLTASTDGVAKLWDAGSLELLRAVQFTNRMDFAGLSRDGRRLFASTRYQACVWEAVSGQRVGPVINFGDRISHVAISPDGSRFAVGRTNGLAEMWVAATGQRVGAPMQHENRVAHVAFSPDGSRLVTSCSDDAYTELYARVWDAVTGRSVTPPLRHADGVLMSAFSPDGRLVVTASEDGAAGIWDATTGRLTVPFLRHRYQVLHAAFSPDGRRVATASRDHTARVWDVRTGEPVTIPLPHEDVVRFVAFSPDGQRLITHDGKARQWSLAPENRPVEDLQALAELLNSREIHATGSLTPVAPARLRQLWQALRARYPDTFAGKESEALAWHRRESESALKSRQWFAAIWHLDRLLVAQPDNSRLLEVRRKAQEALAESREETSR